MVCDRMLLAACRAPPQYCRELRSCPLRKSYPDVMMGRCARYLFRCARRRADVGAILLGRLDAFFEADLVPREERSNGPQD
jgi:hypothetical protein